MILIVFLFFLTNIKHGHLIIVQFIVTSLRAKLHTRETHRLCSSGIVLIRMLIRIVKVVRLQLINSIALW